MYGSPTFIWSTYLFRTLLLTLTDILFPLSCKCKILYPFLLSISTQIPLINISSTSLLVSIVSIGDIYLSYSVSYLFNNSSCGLNLRTAYSCLSISFSVHCSCVLLNVLYISLRLPKESKAPAYIKLLTTDLLTFLGILFCKKMSNEKYG